MIGMAHCFTSSLISTEKHNTEDAEDDRGHREKRARSLPGQAGFGRLEAEAPAPGCLCSSHPHFLSRPLGPSFVSATSGTLSLWMPSITSFASLVRLGISFSGPSKSNSS